MSTKDANPSTYHTSRYAANNYNTSGDVLNNEKDLQHATPKSMGNVAVKVNPTNKKPSERAKICFKCTRWVEVEDFTHVKYECDCSKVVCQACYKALPRASEDQCPVHFQCRVNLREHHKIQKGLW